MYKSFFGLKESPFKITPDLDFFFRQSSRDLSLQSLKYAIDHGEGIIKVVGEVGAGKTTLLRLLLNSLPSKFVPITLPSPTLSPKEVLLFICQSLSLNCSIDLQKHDLVQMISNALVQKVFLDKQLILLVDESQSCSLDTLEEIRLLSNLETEKRKLIQIILFGQTEFDLTLSSLEAKPLKARISSSIYLDEFSEKEVQQYLNYRMRVAGYAGEDLFSLSLAKDITRMTQGLPRAINLVADKLLLLAFSKGSRHLTSKMLKQVPDYKQIRKNNFLFKYLFIFVILILVLYLPFHFLKLDYDKSVFSNQESSQITRKSDRAVLEQNLQDTVLIYQKLPKYFYTGLLFKGTYDDVDAELSKYLRSLTRQQQEKIFSVCEKNKCAVLYGYSNNRDIVDDTLKNLPVTNLSLIKTIRISEVDAIIR